MSKNTMDLGENKPIGEFVGMPTDESVIRKIPRLRRTPAWSVYLEAPVRRGDIPNAIRDPETIGKAGDTSPAAPAPNYIGFIGSA